VPFLRLSDADQERLGCPELLPLAIADITNREIMQIGRLGYRTPDVFRRALSKRGEEMDPTAWTAAVWLALRRAGVQVDIDELEFNADQLAYVPDPDPVEPEPEGKAPARAPSTKPTSTRGGTSRARSRSRSSAS
jgi:hypothetical protein